VLALLRIGLPLAIALAGVILLVIGGDAEVGAGIVLLGVAALVVLANLFIRLAFQSQEDRDREAERRDRH
jgi:hypothetical protein